MISRTLSVIVPIYNKARYVGNLLKCLRNQKFRDFECIIVDDGATDDSGLFCDEMCFNDSSLIVLHTWNKGVSHARNIALDLVNGDYITFVDGDDEIHCDYLSNLISCIRYNKVDIAISGYTKFWDNKNDRIEIKYISLSGFHNFDDLYARFARDQREIGIYGWCWGKIIKAQLTKDIRFDESLKLAEDLDYFLSLYRNSKSVYIDDKPYYFYRQEAENSTVCPDDDKIDYVSQYLIQEKVYQLLRDKGFLNGDNKKICDERLRDYIYCSLYHAKNKELMTTIQKLESVSHNDISKEEFSLSFRYCLLTLYRLKRYKTIQVIKLIYDFGRKCFGRRGIVQKIVRP